MIFVPIAPGRVASIVYLEPGDGVALADRNGCPVGEWRQVMPGIVEMALTVPEGSDGPISHWIARDASGRIQYWSKRVPGQGLWAGFTG